MFLSETTRAMVRMPDIKSVKEFVEIANKSLVPADLVSDRYVVDARSIMGIFSLDLSKSIELRIRAKGKEADEMLESVKKFVTDEKVPEIKGSYEET